MFKKIRKRLAADKVPARKFDDDDFPEAIPDPRGAHGGAERSEPLKDTVHEWMDSLDKAIRPVELAASYPRIALQLMLHWSEPPDVLHNFLNGLILNERNDRQGFSKAVLTELLRLQAVVVDRRDQSSPPEWPAPR